MTGRFVFEKEDDWIRIFHWCVSVRLVECMGMGKDEGQTHGSTAFSELVTLLL